jgi:hypothetical protein
MSGIFCAFLAAGGIGMIIAGRAFKWPNPNAPTEWPLVGVGAALMVIALVLRISLLIGCCNFRAKAVQTEERQAEEGEGLQNGVEGRENIPPAYSQVARGEIR